MKPLKIGAYIRVSTDDQVNIHEGSLDSQKYRIQEFVKFKNKQFSGWGEIIEFYVEEGVSAGTTNRPMYQKAMSDVRQGKVNLILVSDLTRLSRNLLDFCNLINELERHKASYLSMKEQFDTSTPIGRMMVYVIIALGQFEREQTSERVSVNCHSRALRGLLNGGAAPLGYDKNPEKKGLLVVNDPEAEIVRTIFQTFLECGSRSKTIHQLTGMGITPKRTSKKAKEKGTARWTVQTLGSLLQNVTYIGMREVNKIYKDEDSAYLKPWQRYQMVKASWGPILNEETFFEAQKLLEESSQRERARINNGEKRVFLLTGILSCGETGLPLVGQAGRGSSGTVHRYYHYVRRPKDLKKIRPRLNADELEEKLIGQFKTALTAAGYFEGLEALLNDRAEEKNKQSESENIRAKNELSEITQKISTIWSNQARMQLGEDALKLASDELNRLAKQKADLEKYLSGLNQTKVDSEAIKEQSLFVKNQIQALLQGWAKATPAMKKRLIRRTIKQIVVTREEMEITFWLSSDDRDGALLEGSKGDLDDDKNILAFRRPSPRGQNHNLSIQSSGVVRNGSEGRT